MTFHHARAPLLRSKAHPGSEQTSKKQTHATREARWTRESIVRWVGACFGCRMHIQILQKEKTSLSVVEGRHNARELVLLCPCKVWRDFGSPTQQLSSRALLYLKLRSPPTTWWLKAPYLLEPLSPPPPDPRPTPTSCRQGKFVYDTRDFSIKTE